MKMTKMKKIVVDSVARKCEDVLCTTRSICIIIITSWLLYEYVASIQLNIKIITIN